MPKMKIFVDSLGRKIKDDIRGKTVESKDLYVNLESRITEREIDRLLKVHKESELIATKETLTPFIEYLANRWERVKDTDADYVTAPNSFANQVSYRIASGIARVVYGIKDITKLDVTKEQINEFLVFGNHQQNTSANDRRECLKIKVSACINILFDSGEEFVSLMVEQMQKSEWASFIECCDYLSLQELFLSDLLLKQSNNKVYDAITAAAAANIAVYDGDSKMNQVKNLKQQARHFCLLEINKRKRDLDPDYLGTGSWLTGIGKSRRVSQMGVMQAYIVSDKSSFDEYMNAYPKDLNSLNWWGHTKVLADKTREIKNIQVPNETLKLTGNNM